MNKLVHKAIDNYRRFYYNIKLRNFYLQNDDREKSVSAGIIDFILLRLVIFGIGYFWFLARTHSVILSVILSLIIATMLSYGFYLSGKKYIALKKKNKRKQIENEYIIDKLNKLDSEEFKWHLLKLFIKMPSIGSIKDMKDYLLLKLNDEPVAVGYHNDPNNSTVSADIINRFIHRIRLEGINTGIYITTGSYSEEVNKLLLKKTYVKLYLFDSDDLLKLMQKTDMVIDEEIVDKIIHNRIFVKKASVAITREIFRRERFKKYLIYSAAFFIISSIFNIYSVYYNILSALFFIMAVSTYIINLKLPASTSKNTGLIDELTKVKQPQ